LEQSAIKITLYTEGDKESISVNGTSNKTTPFEASLSIDKKFKDKCIVAKVR